MERKSRIGICRKRVSCDVRFQHMRPLGEFHAFRLLHCVSQQIGIMGADLHVIVALHDQHGAVPASRNLHGS
ncbi:hypothetical protein A9O63_20915 [Cereibacter johrii]|nr:hypothetical protein A9O63_20915 [Cereibacter johrii]